MVDILNKVKLRVIVDTSTSSTYIYIGKADRDTATSSALWFVQRIDLTNGADVASASEEFDQIWDNRVSLTYA